MPAEKHTLASFIQQTAPKGGFFITGTHTNIGKTFITCQIATLLHQKNAKKNTQKKHPGLAIFARKPIASGCQKQADGQLISEDALALHQACHQIEPLKTICPHLFEAAISPARAIKQTRTPLTLTDLIKACQTPNKGFQLVEGAGGFYTPLTPDALNKDLAIALNLPIILVVGNQLGCINQCLLTLKAIEDTPLTLAAIVINDTHPNSDYNNFQDIQQLTHHKVLHQPFQA